MKYRCRSKIFRLAFLNVAVVCYFLDSFNVVSEATRVVSKFARCAYRKNRILNKHPVRIVNGIDRIECLDRCMKTQGCQAFNFRPGLCSLLNISLCERKGLTLEDAPGSCYFDLESVNSREAEGPLWTTPFCTEKGLCSRRCEAVVPMKYLNEPCIEDSECKPRTGRFAVCRQDHCKCEDGYWIENITTCTKLPVPGYVRHNTHYYKISKEMLNSKAAEVHCRNHESTLAKVENREVYEFLFNLLVQHNVSSAWVDITAEVKANKVKILGNSIPNIAISRHCTELKTSLKDEKFGDGKCGMENTFICQFKGKN
ncbi:uncharacterized protein LOC106467327 [Limulus polyphemus]|uniref:Uncharacterized protein LOC106467327 n=1 Tax=Limulus polyphemus TaxID=6850 RepID=A0ABM1BJB4_LIMPO|nr:uncharacterized protein LOC106467327 [Limulus polyphemus]